MMPKTSRLSDPVLAILSTVRIGDSITSRDDGDVTWLEFHFPCKHLQSDKTCAIYNDPNRPLLCRRFPYPNSTVKDCPKVRL